MDKQAIINSAINTISIESEAIIALKENIENGFAEAVTKIFECKGRLVVSGIGKSSIIAQKIVATFNSTGTPATFMHAADAIHGDLGMIQPEDIVLIISKSGNSPEIKVLAPLVKGFGNTLIGMVGNTSSFLALNSDVVLNTTVKVEACPNDLAPTSSTTAQMVMGDAIAVCLMNMRGFNKNNFAKFHPGGNLGKKLYLKVKSICGPQKPSVTPNSSIKDVIVEMTKSRLGATAVLDENNEIAGIITDGDIRRMLQKNDLINELTASDIMAKTPKIIDDDALAVEALEKMRSNNINQLLVVSNNNYSGIIHLQDLIREGII
ncbi:MAG: KpsF/GutQ family sugar-phosphate isomerase [Bacteroidetes bacterium]|nr:KpsF/GutQ family sugar-phosphate isomerase [Bacteroidota bacterium]